jgi:hypothetical protein
LYNTRKPGIPVYTFTMPCQEKVAENGINSGNKGEGFIKY